MLSHCGSFDQHALQSLNDYNLFFILPTEILGIWGLVIYRWKSLKYTFPTVYYTSQKFSHCSRKMKKKNL